MSPVLPSVFVDVRHAWRPARTAARLCRHLGGLLLSSGWRMLAWADRMSHPPRPAPHPAEARLEFHAEACALEGALYVDGQFVGRLDGVTRL